ncbi:MAG: MTH938/NDUFAF3 family protein [Candidatus Pacebacteria bacterium]|jgi:hypothetical protein|nr:MTH938/NDUFAF3 family protein [Candidatus Paceibacterota bacterium]
MIEEYKLGLITIDGEDYDYDVQVRWDDEVSEWQRDEDYKIKLQDVLPALEQNPEVIVIGNGEAGMCEVEGEAKRAIEERGIKLIIDKTEQATRTFNIRKEDSMEEEGRLEKVIGLFCLEY